MKLTRVEKGGCSVVGEKECRVKKEFHRRVREEERDRDG